ncbi:RhsIA family immunity protein [Pseudomonas sp. p1(2021b)]|uniref:NTF2 fold immunity protein n=1 Tax=Pseudomonas sp. p1(2021b) TaxID=2874628 RepID=UPI001CCF38F9|nr:NTF2 fold immunity protein [Pseudomonas sp. p1(2021b)]UBM26732.1 RhsIA family immunity protein [Pseudomonas sp. p1(2021b)]
MVKYSVTNLSDECILVLKGFMSEMHGWEADCYKKNVEGFDDDLLGSDIEEVMRNELLDIFNKYVLKGGRNYDRVGNLVCGRHPEYDEGSDQIEIVGVSEKRVSVVIKKTKGLASLFRLTLSLTDGVFMIASRELQSGGRWQKTYI